MKNSNEKKELKKLSNKRYRENNKEHLKLYYKAWYAKHGRKRGLNYQETQKKWYTDHPEAEKAKNLVHRALYRDELFKPKVCTNCGEKSKLLAHHPDYSKPLEVEWLCYSCHRLTHLALNSRKCLTPRSTNDNKL